MTVLKSIGGSHISTDLIWGNDSHGKMTPLYSIHSPSLRGSQFPMGVNFPCNSTLTINSEIQRPIGLLNCKFSSEENSKDIFVRLISHIDPILFLFETFPCAKSLKVTKIFY